MYRLFEEPEVLEIEIDELDDELVDFDELDGALVVVTLILWLEVEFETEAPLPPVA